MKQEIFEKPGIFQTVTSTKPCIFRQIQYKLFIVIHLHVLHMSMWTSSVALSPTPLILFSFCSSLPGVQSGLYRSDANPFIIILPSRRFKERRGEKMGSGWYHWVSRWVAMSVRFNGSGGCQWRAAKGFSLWPPPLTPAHWQKDTN